jgi:hypothetical protein
MFDSALRFLREFRLARVPGRLVGAIVLLLCAGLLASSQEPAPNQAKQATPPAPPPKVVRTFAEAGAALALDQKIINQVKDHPDLMANLEYLSYQIGPRLTGSENLKRANEWTAEKMKSYGLSNVHLEPWTIPAAFERGTAYARMVEPNTGQVLTLASAGWSPSTKGRVTGEVVIVNARNTADLAKYKGKLKNAIVLSRPPSPFIRTNYLFDEGGRGGGGRRGGRGQGGDGAAGGVGGDGAARGGRATPSTPLTTSPPIASAPPITSPPIASTPPITSPPIASPPAQAGGRGGRGGDAAGDAGGGFGRFGNFAFRNELQDFLRTEGVACTLIDAGKPQGLLNMSGSWRGQERANAAEPIPSAYMVHEHYAMLYRLASRPAPARTIVEIELTNKIIPGPITVYNTVGEIRGSEKPDEVVVIGAHLDSWDLGTGTTDNGTGTCCVLETANTLMKAGIKPKRTIRFCLFTGEEEGLVGSREYVKQHKDEMSKISLCLVHDTGTGKVIGLGTQGRDSIVPILESELVSLQPLGLSDINRRSLGGSDHQSFESAGVPGFAVQQDMSEYNFTHHSQSDTFDKVHEADLIEGVQVLAVTAVRVANLPFMLPRGDKPAGGSGSGRGGRGRGMRQEGTPPPPGAKSVPPPAAKAGDTPPAASSAGSPPAPKSADKDK